MQIKTKSVDFDLHKNFFSRLLLTKLNWLLLQGFLNDCLNCSSQLSFYRHSDARLLF